MFILMKKYVLMSSKCEILAKSIAFGEEISEDILKKGQDETLSILKSKLKYRNTDEFRKALSILSFQNTKLTIVHKHTPDSIKTQSLSMMVNTFGESTFESISNLIDCDFIDKKRQSFMIIHSKNNQVNTVGLIYQHDRSGNNIWEILWFTTKIKRNGNGSDIWNHITRLAYMCNVYAILVPSIDTALSFWLTRDNICFSMSNIIFRLNSNVPENVSKICKLREIIINKTIFKSSKLDYHKLYSIHRNEFIFRGEPYKWTLEDGTTHIWFFPKFAYESCSG